MLWAAGVKVLKGGTLVSVFFPTRQGEASLQSQK